MNKIIKLSLFTLLLTLSHANVFAQCGIIDLTASVSDCDGTPNHAIINFNVIDTFSIDSFRLTINNEDFGTYSTATLPLTISNLFAASSYHILVCGDYYIGNDLVECCEDINAIPEDCNPDCVINDAIVETHDCENGQFYVDIEVHAENTGADGFSVVGNGHDYGDFSYDSTFITIGPLAADSITPYEFIITDNHFPDCQFEYNLGIINCDNQCTLGEIQASALCEGGNYAIIDFDAPGMTGAFEVHGDGHNYGVFDYSPTGSNTVTVGPLADISGNQYEFIVIDATNPDCVSSYTGLDVFNCNGDCTLSELEITSHCEGDKYAYISFLSDSSTGSFSVHGNAQDYGTFDYGTGVLTSVYVGPLPEINDDPYEFIITDTANPDCTIEGELENFDCTEGCHIDDLQVEVNDCNNGEFMANLTFNTANVAGTYFVFTNGQVFGPFNYADANTTIGPLNGDGETTYSFYLIDGNDPSCYAYQEIAPVDCAALEDLVWPGDANNNHISDHYDILYVGVGFDAEGDDRAEQGATWSGTEAPDWNQTFEGGLNYKFADCDGNGRIDSADVAVIEDNFGETHGTPTSPTPLPATDLDPAIYLGFPANIPAGVPFEIPIIMGTASTPVHDLYGTAFSITIDPILLESFHITAVQFPESWLGTPGENLIHISNIDASTGRVDIGISRTDHNNESGYGQIATIIGIIDDIAGIADVNEGITILDPVALDASQNGLPIATPVNQITTSIDSNQKSNEVAIINSMSIYPNPSSQNIIQLNNEFDSGFEVTAIHNINGEKVTATIKNDGKEIDTTNLSAGLYIISIKVGSQTIRRKFVKQ